MRKAKAKVTIHAATNVTICYVEQLNKVAFTHKIQNYSDSPSKWSGLSSALCYGRYYRQLYDDYE